MALFSREILFEGFNVISTKDELFMIWLETAHRNRLKRTSKDTSFHLKSNQSLLVLVVMIEMIRALWLSPPIVFYPIHLSSSHMVGWHPWRSLIYRDINNTLHPLIFLTQIDWWHWTGPVRLVCINLNRWTPSKPADVCTHRGAWIGCLTGCGRTLWGQLVGCLQGCNWGSRSQEKKVWRLGREVAIDLPGGFCSLDA